MSKVKITDFLVTMANICRTHYDGCKDCPFDFVDEEHRKGCGLDFLYDEEIAGKVKNIVLKRMKGSEENERLNQQTSSNRLTEKECIKRY